MIGLFFIALALASLSVIIKTLQNGISPMPSSKSARKAIIQLIPQGFDGTLIDLGSGFGTLCYSLAKAFPNAQVIGYESSTVPYLFSKLLYKKNLQFYCQNFLKIPFDTPCIFVTYLYPKGMLLLSEKFKGSPPQSSVLISNTFALPNYTPHQVLHLNDLYRTPIYLYHFPLD